jgi:type VI protein secretion system component VasK
MDAGTIFAGVGALAAVVGTYWVIRIQIRKDHRDQDQANAKDVQRRIDDAIETERARRELEEANKEIRRLQGGGHDS